MTPFIIRLVLVGITCLLTACGGGGDRVSEVVTIESSPPPESDSPPSIVEDMVDIDVITLSARQAKIQTEFERCTNATV